MKRYPEYNATKVEWLRQLPSTWAINKIKFVSRTLAGGTPDTKNVEYWAKGTIPWLPSGKVQDCDLFEKDADTFITKLGLQDSATKVIPSNSILIALTGATCGNVAHLHFEATANQSVVAMPGSKAIDSRFLFYCLLGIREQILLNKTGGAQSGINEGDVKNIQIPYPSLREQKAIAKYLDFKAHQIDKFILNRKEQIRLLQEERISKIDRALTNNDGHLPLILINETKKPKSFAGWQVSKIKYALSALFLGLASKVDYVDNPEEGYPLVRASDFSNGILRFDNVKSISIAQHKKITRNRRAKFQDILFSKSGTIGAVAIVDVDREFSIYESVFVLRALETKLHFKFLFYILQSNYFKIQYSSGSVGMGVEHLNLGDIKENYIAYPDILDQVHIVEHLEKELKEIDTLISKYEMQIKLMIEYKSAIVNQAVTGKIDVREWKTKTRPYLEITQSYEPEAKEQN